jgi:hypothetical protein
LGEQIACLSLADSVAALQMLQRAESEKEWSYLRAPENIRTQGILIIDVLAGTFQEPFSKIFCRRWRAESDEIYETFPSIHF